MDTSIQKVGLFGHNGIPAVGSNGIVNSLDVTWHRLEQMLSLSIPQVTNVRLNIKQLTLGAPDLPNPKPVDDGSATFDCLAWAYVVYT